MSGKRYAPRPEVGAVEASLLAVLAVYEGRLPATSLDAKEVATYASGYLKRPVTPKQAEGALAWLVLHGLVVEAPDAASPPPERGTRRARPKPARRSR